MVERDGTEREGGECEAREKVGGEEEVGGEGELFPLVNTRKHSRADRI